MGRMMSVLSYKSIFGFFPTVLLVAAASLLGQNSFAQSGYGVGTSPTVDLDTLFEPVGTGTPCGVTGFKVGAQDLGQRYLHKGDGKSYFDKTGGTKVGIKTQNGTDLAEECAGKGTPPRKVEVKGTNITSATQMVPYGSSGSLSVTAVTGYTVDYKLTDTCRGGNYSSGTYTTGVFLDTDPTQCESTYQAKINTYTVSSSGSGVSLSAYTTTANYNSSVAIAVSANTGYTRSDTVTGDCPAGSWSSTTTTSGTYTFGPITAACSITFYGNAIPYNASYGGSNLSVSNLYPTVYYGGTAWFYVTANAGYTVSTTVTTSGSCSTGAWWSGPPGYYYTGAFGTGDCTVNFTANINSYTITASGTNVTLSSSSETANYSSPVTFTVTPSAGYTTPITVNDSGCPSAGSWTSPTVYQSAGVTSNCAVSFTPTASPTP